MNSPLYINVMQNYRNPTVNSLDKCRVRMCSSWEEEEEITGINETKPVAPDKTDGTTSRRMSLQHTVLYQCIPRANKIRYDLFQ
jgi:hypothetical protein